jgi:hypothetical protein
MQKCFSVYIPRFLLFINCLYSCIEVFQGRCPLIAVSLGFTGHVMVYYVL